MGKVQTLPLNIAMGFQPSESPMPQCLGMGKKPPLLQPRVALRLAVLPEPAREGADIRLGLVRRVVAAPLLLLLLDRGLQLVELRGEALQGLDRVPLQVLVGEAGVPGLHRPEVARVHDRAAAGLDVALLRDDVRAHLTSEGLGHLPLLSQDLDPLPPERVQRLPAR
eukprot:CAMPEP_0179372258 /NCGR_PEP_ID=MMETSP0797-20121207/86165_1 /TAXON_ID=47934 /ORGANISM="Dinophysis acuminata, Strain DAEP01" /LENGTH=166 /DNA_ID=CAMNT_0021088169 /DNA_START=12 /DNA_END=508 /DNA_ORIENTATION=+